MFRQNDGVTAVMVQILIGDVQIGFIDGCPKCHVNAPRVDDFCPESRQGLNCRVDATRGELDAHFVERRLCPSQTAQNHGLVQAAKMTNPENLAREQAKPTGQCNVKLAAGHLTDGFRVNAW